MLRVNALRSPRSGNNVCTELFFIYDEAITLQSLSLEPPATFTSDALALQYPVTFHNELQVKVEELVEAEVQMDLGAVATHRSRGGLDGDGNPAKQNGMVDRASLP